MPGPSRTSGAAGHSSTLSLQMKTIISSFLLALAAAFALTAQGQTKFQNFTLGENQYLLGNSTDDLNYQEGSSANKGDVLLASTVYADSYAKLKNCRAVGIRFCLPMVVDVKAVTLFKMNKTKIYEQAPSKVVKGWNYVAFDEPQTLDPNGVLISYTYTQTQTNYGICHWYDSAPGGYLMRFNGQWSDWSEFYGALCLQLIVEADPLPEFGLEPESVENDPVVMNEEGNLVVNFVSYSKNSISDFSYNLSIGDKEVSGGARFDKPLPAGIAQRGTCSVKMPVMDAYGNYDARLSITQVNGTTLDPAVDFDFKQSVYTRRAKRHTLVEENTGTACGNCPRAWVGMEYLKEHYPDDFLGIAIHQYNQSDPMYCARYANLGFGGTAPLCVVDRKVQTDPYYGTTHEGIQKDVEHYSAIAPPVDVSVTGTYTADMKKVTCEASVEWLTDTGKYTIAYALTADGLHSTNAAWLQTNSYCIATAGPQYVLDVMPEFTQFFKGESNGDKMVELTYNDVLVGSSYSSTGSNGTKSLGATKHTAGEVVNHSYTCQFAIGTAAKEVLDYDNLYVTALVIDNEGKIANAARAKVYPIPDGVATMAAPEAVPEACYDLQGRQLAAPAKGISIVGGKKVIR